MRRTTGLVITAATLLVFGGAAAAAPAGGGTGATSTVDGASPAGDAGGGPSRVEVNRLRSAAGGAPERVGTTDRVDRTITRTTTFSYPQAGYVKVHFSRLELSPGGYVTVSDATGDQARRYPDAGTPAAGAGPDAPTGPVAAMASKLVEAVSQTLAGPAGRLGGWAMSVQGDTAVVTIHGGGSATVDKVAHGFTPLQRSRQKAVDRARRDAAVTAMHPGSRTESVCGRDDSADAACYKSTNPVAYKASKAVARLLIDGDELCSAWRVGPDNRMFTNHHCFTTTAQARDTEVWFNYECARCGGYATLQPVKVWGDQVLATDANLDYTLFTVEDFTAISRFGYLTLDVRDPDAGEQLYIPQHPAGVPTVISMSSDSDANGNCVVVDPAAWGYQPGSDVSYYCDTAGGSSGSPVISRRTNKVIALHHFGGCPNSGVRIDLIYRQVASLL